MEREICEHNPDKMTAILKREKLRRALMKTACNGFAMFILGLIISMRGPSFIDIQLISGTDVEKGSFYFTASATGYMMGSLFAGGFLYDRVQMKMLLMVIPIILAGLFFALTPWCTHFVLMLLAHTVVSVFCAIFETTANVEEVHEWEGKSDSAMQFLSFMYSFGGIIGPLIVEPFLAPKKELPVMPLNSTVSYFTMSSSGNTQTYQNRSSLHGHTDLTSTQNETGPGTSDSTFHYDDVAVQLSNTTLDDVSSSVHHDSDFSVGTLYNISQEGYLDRMAPTESRIHYGYLIGGLLAIFAAIPFCLLHVKTRKSNNKTDEVAFNKLPERKLPFKYYVLLTGMVSALFFFYTTVDDSFSMYISVFVVSHLKWSKEEGAIVSSLYWGCSTVTKLAMVVLVRCVNTSAVLLLSTIGMTISMIILTISAHYHLHLMVWVSTACLALSQSSVFGGGFSWADSHLLKMDGKVTSCAMIFASLGAVVDPVLLGVSMKEISAMSFPYLLTIQAFITLLIFFVMLVIAKPVVTRRFGPPRPEINTCINETEVGVRVEGKGSGWGKQDEANGNCHLNGNGVHVKLSPTSVNSGTQDEGNPML